MLPPTLTFTIPSVHDGLPLDCRIFHPACLSPSTISQNNQIWGKKAAIVAHPYAPLGGSYDDPVVELTASTILKQGFVVATFNFRGAGSSKGRTSWSSKAEQSDYISVLGFVIFYMQYLFPFSTSSFEPFQYSQSEPELHSQLHTNHLTPIPSATISPNPKPVILLAGYSYGAMITSCLPPMLKAIIIPFQDPVRDSPYEEIRHRARFLATQQNESTKAEIATFLQRQKLKRGKSLQLEDLQVRKTSGGVRIGGEENLRRASHDSYRSRSSFTIETPELVRRSVDRMRSITTKPPRLGSSNSSHGLEQRAESEAGMDILSLSGERESLTHEGEVLHPVEGIIDNIQVAYLLVSPLVGFVENLAKMWSSKVSIFKGKERERETVDNDIKFAVDPTLALFGDDDIFVSIKRLRSWAGKLRGEFSYKEIPRAGHFWHDHDARTELRSEINAFAKGL